MLEQGKISCDEAVKLLEALDNTPENNKKKEDNDTIISKALESTLKDLNSKISSISKSLSDKFESFGKEINGKDVMNTDNISKNLKILEAEYMDKLENIITSISKDKEGISSILFNKKSRVKKKKASDKFNISVNTLETCFKDMPLNISEYLPGIKDIINNLDIKNESANNLRSSYKRSLSRDTVINLTFENINGNISIENYDEEDIKINVSTRSSHKNIREIITLINEKNNYGIKASSIPGIYLHVEASIPSKKISNINISSSNGRINISDVRCSSICLTSYANRIYLSGIYCKSFQAAMEKSKIEFSDITLDKIVVKSIDTPLLIYNSNCLNYSINTTNSRVLIELSEDCRGCGLMDISNRNGRIDIDLTQCMEMGASIEAINNEGSIDIMVPGIIYCYNENLEQGGNQIICQTKEYEHSKNKIMIKAVTSKEAISIK